MMGENELKDIKLGDVIKEGSKKAKTIGGVIAGKAEQIATKHQETQTIKAKKGFNVIKNEVGIDTSANNWYMIFAPIIGFIMQPAILLLVLDINEDQLRIIKATLIASGIGLVITVFLIMIAFRDGINKTILSVFRHFTTKKELSDLEVAHMTQSLEITNKENKELKLQIETLNKDLFEYNIDKEIKKRNS